MGGLLGNTLRHMTKTTVYSWLLQRLEGRGKQTSLAKAIGIDPQMLNRTLHGGREMKPAEVVAIAKFFGISEKEVLTGESENQADSYFQHKKGVDGADAAIVFMMKMIMKSLLEKKILDKEWVQENINYAMSHYRMYDLADAILVMEQVMEFLGSATPPPEPGAPRKLLQLAPLGSA